MKTYTLTWRCLRKWNKSGLSRMRFLPGSLYWYHPDDFSAVKAFLALWCSSYFSDDVRDLRLFRAGRLVARAATYQGV